MKERESGRSICFGSRCRNEIKWARWRASDKMESGQESEEARNAAGATKHAYIHWALRIDHFEQKVRPSIILMIGFRHLNIFPPILYTFKDEEEGREARLKRESERDGGRRRRRRRRRERERDSLRFSHLSSPLSLFFFPQCRFEYRRRRTKKPSSRFFFTFFWNRHRRRRLKTRPKVQFPG